MGAGGAAGGDDVLEVGLDVPPRGQLDLVGRLEVGLGGEGRLGFGDFGGAEIVADVGAGDGDAGDVLVAAGEEAGEVEAAIDVVIDEVRVRGGTAGTGEDGDVLRSLGVDLLIDDAVDRVVGAAAAQVAPVGLGVGLGLEGREISGVDEGAEAIGALEALIVLALVEEVAGFGDDEHAAGGVEGKAGAVLVVRVRKGAVVEAEDAGHDVGVRIGLDVDTDAGRGEGIDRRVGDVVGEQGEGAEGAADEERGAAGDEELIVDALITDLHRDLVVPQSFLDPEFIETKRVVGGDVAGDAEIVDEGGGEVRAVNVEGVDLEGEVLDRAAGEGVEVEGEGKLEDAVADDAAARAAGEIAEDLAGPVGLEGDSAGLPLIANAEPGLGEIIPGPERFRRGSGGRCRRGDLRGRG